MTNRNCAPHGGTGYAISWLVPILILPAILLAGCGGGRRGASPAPYTSTAADTSAAIRPEVDAYRVLVSDELNLTVLGNPELTTNLRVLPDGTITIPGVGQMYVLGQTVPEITGKVREAVSKVVRYPQVSVGVTNFGERRIFVIGEVNVPGDRPYHNGLTALSAVAMAGGFTNGAKRGSVIVLRRLDEEKAVAFRLDLRDPLKGKKLEQNIPVKPFDIVYVPKTFIASVDVLVDQYFRQLTPPFTMYVEGWNAFHIDRTRVTVVSR